MKLILKLRNIQFSIAGLFWLIVMSCAAKERIVIQEQQYQTPVLIGKKDNPILRIKVTVPAGTSGNLTGLRLTLDGTTTVNDLNTVQVYYYGKDSLAGTMQTVNKPLFGAGTPQDNRITIDGSQVLNPGDHYFWVTVTLSEKADLQHLVDAQCTQLIINDEELRPKVNGDRIRQRIGVAVRQHGQDGVHTSRIPGLATTNKGTLLAIFDARYASARDLQGDMDIALHRSEDGGKTWQPMQIALDMGEWEGLPQKFNGVSDACILIDKNSDAIYIAGLWMHGVLDEDGNWVEHLNEQSENWNHQWRNKGSQPGYDVKQSAQFLITKSTDDGKTWSKPVNLTKMGKDKNWWLWAPAPGQGITLKDGTLVFPTQGRDETGETFSNITYSKDGGNTWKTSKPALQESTTECMAVELADGSVMLNMRANSNKGNEGAGNGRAVAVSHDLGEQWQVHSTSHQALQEPVCMASIIGCNYQLDGNMKHFLFFSNPNSKTKRHRMAIKVSADEGLNWSEYKPFLLDELNSRGYSCLTVIDNETIGILYESSQADMVFQAIKIKDLL